LDFPYFENYQNDAILQLIYGMTLVWKQHTLWYSLCH